MTWAAVLVCVFCTVSVFIVGLYVGAHLTYTRQAGRNPLPFTTGKAILRRMRLVGGVDKGKDSEPDPNDSARRWTS